MNRLQLAWLWLIGLLIIILCLCPPRFVRWTVGKIKNEREAICHAPLWFDGNAVVKFAARSELNAFNKDFEEKRKEYQKAYSAWLARKEEWVAENEHESVILESGEEIGLAPAYPEPPPNSPGSLWAEPGQGWHIYPVKLSCVHFFLETAAVLIIGALGFVSLGHWSKPPAPLSENRESVNT